MGDSYVCSKAKIKCSCGDKISTLTVYPDRTIWLTGEPQANISDHISMRNIAPFGKCHTTRYPATGSATAANHGKLTPMPCVPNTPFAWMGGKDDVLLQNQPALLKSSICKCVWGGTITITFDGQTEGNQSPVNTERLQTQEQLNHQKDNAKLPVDSVLDGIQLALDAAGFVPGMGAIPDILNASISACRGNWGDAGLSLLAAVPVIGDAAVAAKLAKRGVNIAQKSKKLVAKPISIRSFIAQGMTMEEAKTLHRAVRNERRNVAKNFYKTHNPEMTPDQIESHIRGIDFMKPVEVGTFKPSAQNKISLYQYQRLSDKGKYLQGHYFTTSPRISAEEVGVLSTHSLNDANRATNQLPIPFPKQQFTGVLEEETVYLKSTARRIKDNWSMHGQSIEVKGGAEQIYIPKNNAVPNMTKVN